MNVWCQAFHFNANGTCSLSVDPYYANNEPARPIGYWIPSYGGRLTSVTHAYGPSGTDEKCYLKDTANQEQWYKSYGCDTNDGSEYIDSLDFGPGPCGVTLRGCQACCMDSLEKGFCCKWDAQDFKCYIKTNSKATNWDNAHGERFYAR